MLRKCMNLNWIIVKLWAVLVELKSNDFSWYTQFKNQYRHLRKMRQIETTTTYTHTHTHTEKAKKTIQIEFSKRIRFNGE